MEDRTDGVQEVEAKDAREEIRLACLCPVHRRHRFLDAVRRHLLQIPADVRIFYFADRPTEKVRDFIGPHGNCFEIPPIVDAQQGDFPTAWSRMVELVENEWPEVSHMGIWDDDMVLTFPEQVPNLLECSDLVYGPKLFLWDDIGHYNAKLEHNSVVFWRHRRGDRFHAREVMQVHAPQGVHDDPKSMRTKLVDFILDYGFMSVRDRKCVFEREIRTGKIDGFTRPLVEPPELRTLPDGLLHRSVQASFLFAPE